MKLNGIAMMTIVSACTSTATPTTGSGSSGVRASSAPGSSVTTAVGDAATATPAQLALDLAVSGHRVTFTLHNRGKAPLVVLTRVLAGEVHYDWFTVEISDSGGATRRLRFIDDRDRSGTEKIPLEPGASWSGDADLKAWAARRANGALPLPTGEVTLRATYQVPDSNPGVWVGKLDAAPVTITW